ncbi:uncharacterized protein LOC136089870 [Hydra vulgaris]|uniref:Uncharacterized protein LOC136089870 n=1 Tax=Hydra vulgaris TaxID=6087 RepID=A0ABM4DCA6_HYDVU
MNFQTFLKEKLSTIWNKSEDNENHPLLCDNYSLCLKRFKSLEKKFLNDTKLIDSYNDIIKEQLLNGTVKQVLSNKSKVGLVHYLPHRPVIREDKVTTKMRMVFDESATNSGPSLNDCLHSDIKNLKNHKLVTYKLCRVLFGVTSSPFLLSATLISHAERYTTSDPIFVSRLINSIHVDDLSFCTDSVIECFKFYEKCRSRLGEAGFNLRKF